MRPSDELVREADELVRESDCAVRESDCAVRESDCAVRAEDIDQRERARPPANRFPIDAGDGPRHLRPIPGHPTAVSDAGNAVPAFARPVHDSMRLVTRPNASGAAPGAAHAPLFVAGPPVEALRTTLSLR